MNRTEFLEEAVAMARNGVLSLLIDASMVRPGGPRANDAGSYARSFRQDVIDLRRGVDLLLARRDVDAKRLAYVGHSFHAVTGAVLAGIDSRVHEGLIYEKKNFNCDRMASPFRHNGGGYSGVRATEVRRYSF